MKRKREDGMQEETRRNTLAGRYDCWPSMVLLSFGEVEGSLWHVWAELLGWQQKVESLLETVDGG